MILRSERIERVSVAQTCEARPLLSTKSFHRGCVSQTISALGKVSRNAETAGNVCTMSPSEPRRKTKKRGSAMRSLANGFKKIACGVILWIADDSNADAQTRGSGALWHGFSGIVGSFGVNVWKKGFEQRLDAWLAKENHVIDGAKRSDEERASVLIKNGAARTL